MGSDAVLGPALAQAVADLRERLGDGTAAIAIVTPSNVNGTLAQRELAFATSYVRVETWTAAELEGVLAEAGLRRAGLAPEPAGWLRTTVAGIVATEELPGGYHEVLREAGWAGALTSAIVSLESGRVSAELMRTLPLGPGLAERNLALAHLMGRVRERRAFEKIAGPEALADAALAAVNAKDTSPATAARGVVLLGDARLPRTTFEVLKAWLGQREVVRVEPHELASLPPDTHGLSRAAPNAKVVELPARTPSVQFVRTPDPTREMHEAVREAQAAVARDVPLDRIAIVLPDPAEATALADALSHAELPATWLTGRPLVETPASRFLLHALDIALGHDSALQWYDLLRRPELRLRAVLGEPGARGRGRWRRLLASTRVARGTSKIVAELAHLRAEPGRDGETDAMREARLAAIDALVHALETLDAALSALRATRTVGAHARELRELVRKWWAPTQDQAIVARLLEQWGRSLRGPAIDLVELAATLRETLESTETLSGGLKDSALRVLSPMQLLGAELDVVLVTGVTEGRFPRRPSEDPVLADAIIEAIEKHEPAGLFRSGDRVVLERRRLASIRSAARGALWLSAPLVEMLKGRPLQPGSVLLDFGSELEGRRVLPSELAKKMTPVGRRSRAWPSDASRALGPLEHLLARLFGTDPEVARAALEALVDHALARRIVVAERARDRVARGEVAPDLRAFAGFVEPSAGKPPGLDGEPLRPSELVELLQQPETFFLRRVLNAWPAKTLRDGWDPVAPWWVERTLLDESRVVLVRNDDIATRLRAAFDARAADELTRAGEADAEALTRLGNMAARAIDAFVGTRPATGTITPLAAAPIAGDLPWRLRDGEARRVGSGLEWVVAEVPGPRSLGKALAELLEAAARGATAPVNGVRFVDLAGGIHENDDPTTAIRGAVDAVRLAQPAIEAGYFPPKADPERFAEWVAANAAGEP